MQTLRTSSAPKNPKESIIAARDRARQAAPVWMLPMVNHYLHELDQVKKLPKFYYLQAARRLEIDASLCRKDYLRYPVEHMPPGATQCHDLVSVLNTVSKRVANWPKGENFQDGINRLNCEIDLLLDQGYTFQNIADHLRLKYHTIYQNYRRINTCQYCPYEMAEQLQSIRRLPPGKRETPQEKEARRKASMSDVTEEPTVMPQTFREYFIMPGHRCAKCGAAWTNLYRNGEDQQADAVIFTCRHCGTDNLLDTGEGNRDEDVNQHELIKEGAQCYNCGAPWSEIRIGHQEGTGEQVRYCGKCFAHIRLRRRARGGKPA